RRVSELVESRRLAFQDRASPCPGTLTAGSPSLIRAPRLTRSRFAAPADSADPRTGTSDGGTGWRSPGTWWRYSHPPSDTSFYTRSSSWSWPAAFANGDYGAAAHSRARPGSSGHDRECGECPPPHSPVALPYK